MGGDISGGMIPGQSMQDVKSKITSPTRSDTVQTGDDEIIKQLRGEGFTEEEIRKYLKK